MDTKPITLNGVLMGVFTTLAALLILLWGFSIGINADEERRKHCAEQRQWEQTK